MDALNVRSLLLLTLFSFTLSHCAGGGGASNTNLLGGGFATGEVRALEFNANGDADLNFGELSGGEQFALIFFGANAAPGNYGVQLKSARDLSSPPRLLRSPSPELPDTQWLEGDPTSSFHELLREEEQIISQTFSGADGEKFLAGSTPADKTLSGAWLEYCDENGISMRVINNLSNTNSYETICAIERRTTTHAIYYVDRTINNTLPDSLINQVIDDFEAKIDRERALIGAESDVNGDGHFAVCFCPTVNRLGASVGGYVTGFFFGGDLFSQEAIPSSNEKEILFISVPDPSGQWGTVVPADFWVSNIAVSVLPHEYQHMISYRHKVLDQEIGAEESWANEGLSHLFEDLSAQPGDPLPWVGKENPSRVAMFLQNTQLAAFTGGTSLAQRGGAYLFFRYLYEQANLGRFPGVANGGELLNQLLSSPYKGVQNIEETTGWSFRNILLDFYATLQLSNTGLTDDAHYNFQGIDLYGAQDDNRGTVLNGVNSQSLASVPISGTINSPGGLFFNLSGSTIEGAGNALSFSADPGMVPGGAVIRLQ